MFRHKGKSRTFKHNLRLAALLSFIAGLVNITGVLSLGILTTNVTGHFAFFAEELMQKNYLHAFNFLIYILAFLAGAFFSSIMTEYFANKGFLSAHKYAMLVEIILLFTVGVTANLLHQKGVPHSFIASVLLFAMGMQNALVTQISNSIVRTTHLTGLFTDLGIELSQLIFYKERDAHEKLIRSIVLRISIIFFFFIGCVAGGFLYAAFFIKTLLIAAALLSIALTYDFLLFRFYKLKRLKKLK